MLVAAAAVGRVSGGAETNAEQESKPRLHELEPQLQPADGAQKRKKTRRGATIINSNYRYMGGSKVYGMRAVVPLDWRMQMLAAMDPQYTTIRTSRLDEVSTDQLIYIRTDIRPSLRIGATRANTKEDLIQMVDATAASKSVKPILLKPVAKQRPSR